MRKNISSGATWEDILGYSRAVRVGNIIEVAGTTAMDGDKVVGRGDIYAQTRFALKKIEMALLKAEATLNDVVRTRIYVVDITKWEEVAKAHGEFFKDIKPVSTMVEVKRLIKSELLVEIEATAILDVN